MLASAASLRARAAAGPCWDARGTERRGPQGRKGRKGKKRDGGPSEIERQSLISACPLRPTLLPRCRSAAIFTCGVVSRNLISCLGASADSSPVPCAPCALAVLSSSAAIRHPAPLSSSIPPTPGCVPISRWCRYCPSTSAGRLGRLLSVRRLGRLLSIRSRRSRSDQAPISADLAW